MRVQSNETLGHRDAESIFRSKPISEIRNVEASTRTQIQLKQDELRQLVGNRYRDLIDSADSIVLMKSSAQSISENITYIHSNIEALSSKPDFDSHKLSSLNTVGPKSYSIACRVKYLVDTPENIWGCLDEYMFLEASARYIRAKQVHHGLMNTLDSQKNAILSGFPLLQHQWQIVESFKAQISQRAPERLLDRGLEIGAYADALAATSIIDELYPKQILGLFLESRRSWVLKQLGTCSSSEVLSVFCDVLSIVQITVGQVGELFLRVLNDMPLYYKVLLGSPPASQLFGGIPNPDEEVGLWNIFRDMLESVNVILDRDFVASTCLNWVIKCGEEIVSKVNGKYLIDDISNGQQLASAEKLIRETMDSKEVMEGSLEWLRNVFGLEVEMPWSNVRELVLNDDLDLWDEIFENAFVNRMKWIIESHFNELARSVSVIDSVRAITELSEENVGFETYFNRPSTGGGVWFVNDLPIKRTGEVSLDNDFISCLNIYFGPEVSRIKDAVDTCCQMALEDLLSFLESPNASLRLKALAPYLQDKCYGSIAAILIDLKVELEQLYAAMSQVKKEDSNIHPTIILERSLFIGRILFAFQNYLKHVPVILGSPRFWVKETVSSVFDKLPSLLKNSRVTIDSPRSDSPGRQLLSPTRRHNSLANAALLGAIDNVTPNFEELGKTISDLCIETHSLWISWVSDELSFILSRDLKQDESLSTTSPLRGWEETVVKQEQSTEGQSDMKILLPSIPSLYVTSFLFRACEEIHRIGGHILEKSILQKFAMTLLDKVVVVYSNFIPSEQALASQFSEKGILQVLLDLRFITDVLSGGDFKSNLDSTKKLQLKSPFRWKQDLKSTKSAIGEHVNSLINRLSQNLDPIDWLTYESYLWENERQSYLRHVVLFGFFVQLNRMYTDSVQKLPTNSESNILRCSIVPRFKYLPISAPALSSRGTTKTSIVTSIDDDAPRSFWNAYTNSEISPKIDFDDNPSFGLATPFLKSFMQAGSRFGESTFKLGSILSDGQVGIFKDKSALAMSTFGDILPAQAAGLLSSFTVNLSDS